MSFGQLERIVAAAKNLQGGVIDSDPTAQWYESSRSFSFSLPGRRVWTQEALLYANPAANQAEAQANCAGPLSGVVQDFSLPVDAIRLSPIIGVNNTYIALSIYGDFSSTWLDNWLKPQFVPQLSGLPSFGYTTRLYDGDPNAGGVEVMTTDGTTGTGINKSVAWIWNYDNGMLLLADDFAVADPWILGFRYIGTTAGGGGGAVAVEYNGVPLTPSATILNFINGFDPDGHDGVLATLPGAPAGQVNLYIHPPEFASHWGTVDGIGDGRVSWQTKTPAYMSKPTSPGVPYYAGSWDDNTVQDGRILTASFVAFSSADSYITELDNGTITVTVRNGNTPRDVYTCSLVLDGTTGAQSNTADNITIDVDNLITVAYRIEGRLRITVNLAAIIGVGGGYFELETEHVCGSGTFADNFGSAFWDRGLVPVCAIPTVTVNTEVLKWLSGVPWYDTGTTFDLASGPCANEVNSTIDQDKDVVAIDASEFNANVGEVDYDAATITGLTYGAGVSPTFDETPSYGGTITVGGGNFRDNNAILHATWHNIHGSDADNSVSTGIQIDTYGTTATPSTEYFDDEAYRLQDEDDNNFAQVLADYRDWVGTGGGSDLRDWDSTQNIDTGTPGHVEGSQVGYGVLQYPTVDYSVGHLPVGPNYSGLSGDRYYYRAFYVGDLLNHKNFTVTMPVSGLTSADFDIGLGGDDSTDCRIDIKFPGPPKATPDGSNTALNPGSGWLHCGKAYNSAAFTGIDNDGCMVSVSGAGTLTFSLTTENMSTEYSDGILIVRIRMKDSVAANDTINQMTIVGT